MIFRGRLRDIVCILLSLCIFISVLEISLTISPKLPSDMLKNSITLEKETQPDLKTNNYTQKLQYEKTSNEKKSILKTPFFEESKKETSDLFDLFSNKQETNAHSKPEDMPESNEFIDTPKVVHFAPSRAPHSPIRIDSDLDFDIQFPGRVISGFDINGGGVGTCIYIGNCTLPFIIENCNLTNANGNSNTYYWNSNIVIYNSVNGIIRRNNITSASSAGVLIRNSFNNLIEKNDFYGNQYGIYLYQSNNSRISENGINYSTSYGIYLYESNCTISSWNQINRNNYGIYIYRGEQNSFSNETIMNNGARGIRVYSSNWNRFENITALFHTYAIHIDSCKNNTIEWSNLSKSTSYGFYFFSGENNSVRNSTINENLNYGGYIDSTINAIVSNCIILSNLNRGISSVVARVEFYSNTISGSNQYGIYLSSCDNSYIFGNNITSINQTAIYVYMSDSSSFISNRIEGNWTGIYLYNSQSCYFDGNKMYLCGFYIYGIVISYWNTHVITTTNTVNGRIVYYLKNGLGGTVPSDGGQVILANYVGAVVDGLNLSCASAGVLLGYSYNNIIRNCDAHSNYMVGIYLYYSEGNNVSNNDFSGYSLYGIYLYYSNANTIINNKIYDNFHDAIYIYGSESLVLKENKMSYGGIYISDNSLQYWNTHEISSTNTVNGGNVYYFKNGTGGNVPADAGQVIIANYSHLSIKNHLMAWGSVGVSIVYSNNITLNNVSTSYNYHDGVYVYDLRDSRFSNLSSQNNVNYAGIYLTLVYNLTIENSNFDRNRDGLYSFNIYDSNFSKISCQNETRYGVYFSNSQRNTFQALNIDYCGNYGFYSISSSEYRFSYCNFNHSSYGFYTSTSCLNNEFIRCNFNYNSQNGFYGRLISSSNFTWNNFIFNSNYGIYLSSANYNTFLYNNFSSNRYGVYITGSSNNSFLGCRFYFNTLYGAYVTGSSTANNVFHHNNFIDNNIQAYDAQVVNSPPTAYAGNFIMGTNVAGNYLNSANCYAESPTIDCTGKFNVHLQFYRWLVLEIGYDYGYVEVSNDTGLNYNQVGPTLNLRDTSWNFIDLNISTIADNQNNVKIRFRLTSDGSIVYSGWNIDELTVVSDFSIIFYDGFETLTGWTFGGTNNNWDIGTPVDITDKWDNQTNTGNYWSNWLGPDADGNGIVDIPYSLSGSAGRKDYYPVTTPFILENFPPILSLSSVTPIGGSIHTTFTYSVTYSDINGDIPFVARVYIDGVPYSLNYISGDHTTGALYQYSTTLPEGPHYYSFYFDDGNGSITTSPILGNFSGPHVNFNPHLSFHSLTPNNGTTETTFNFSIIYTDLDNLPPSIALIYIDGIPYEMTYISGSNGTGALYSYQTTLSEGPHYYYYYFEDENGTVIIEPNIGYYPGPYVNYIPVLSSHAVSPLGGNISTLFTYSITYSDVDGDNPSLAQVYIDGTPYTMSYISGSNQTGALYQYSITLSQGFHTYYFYFKDGNGSAVRFPSIGYFIGPQVNFIPTLTIPSLSPISGNISTIFTYSITYHDIDGDSPSQAYVYIDGTPCAMSYISGSNQTGALYQYTTTLSEGFHTYYFYFNDGNGSESYSPIAGFHIGPIVNHEPRTEVGYVSPSLGNRNTLFTYNITYLDLDGTQPAIAKVYIDGIPHNLTYVSGSFMTGANYTFTTTLALGEHNYYFYFEDENGSVSRFPASAVLIGPTVLENISPSLTSPLLVPTSGNEMTLFTYSIIYTDADGDMPTSALIYIDGNPYQMNFTSGDFFSGAIFSYSTYLPVGMHNYSFVFNDGNHTVYLPDNDTYSGPEVVYSGLPSVVSFAPISGIYKGGQLFELSWNYEYAPSPKFTLFYSTDGFVSHNVSIVSTSATNFTWILPSIDASITFGILLESNGKTAWAVSNTIEVDSTLPAIYLISPTESCIPTNSLIRFQITDANIKNANWTIIKNGVSGQTNLFTSPYEILITEPTACEITLVVRALDLAGNYAEKTFNFNIYLNVSIVLQSISDGSTIEKGTNISFEITNATYANYSVDGLGEYEFTNGYVIYTVQLSNGTHTFSIHAYSGCKVFTQNYTFVIISKINQRPVISGLNASINMKDKKEISFSIAGKGFDPDDAPSTLKWSVKSSSSLFNVYLDESNALIKIRRNTTKSGEDSFSIILTDPLGNYDTFTIHVKMDAIRSTTIPESIFPWLILIALIAVSIIIAFAFVTKRRDKKERITIELNEGLSENYNESTTADITTYPTTSPIVKTPKAHEETQHAEVPIQSVESVQPAQSIQPSASLASQSIASQNEKIEKTVSSTPQTNIAENAYEKIEPKKDTKSLSSLSAQNVIEPTEIEPVKGVNESKVELKEEIHQPSQSVKPIEQPPQPKESKPMQKELSREDRLKNGVELCESYGVDVSKAKEYLKKLENASTPEARTDTLKVAELYLKVALKKAIPPTIKVSREKIAQHESEGNDCKNIKEIIKKLEQETGEGNYLGMVDGFIQLDSEMKKFVPNIPVLVSSMLGAPSVPKTTNDNKIVKDAQSKKNKNRLVFLDGKVYHINELGCRKSFRILKGLSEEDAKTLWLTIDAPETTKGLNIPPDIEVKDLKGIENQFEVIMDAILKISNNKRFAVMIDFLPSLMTISGTGSTFRLIAALDRLLKGKSACILIPMSPALLSATERSELRKLTVPVDDPEEHLNWLNSPDRTVTAVVRCAICMGHVKPGLPVTICSCGKKFHEACANRVGECPGCARKF